jgi:hypothetical protein
MTRQTRKTGDFNVREFNLAYGVGKTDVPAGFLLQFEIRRALYFDQNQRSAS